MRLYIAAVLGVIFLSFGGLASASSEYSEIFYFRDGEVARQSLHDHYSYIKVLAPQFYAFGPTGALEGEVNSDVVSFARGHGIKVMPLITNKSFSQKGLAILDNKVAQSAAITALVTEAKKMGYVGYQIDFEQMDMSYKKRFTSFVDKLHKGLQDNGLILSVAVIAKVSDNPADYKEGLYQKLIGVYDYAALSKASDFVSIMSYDDPGSKGPVARYEWLKSVIRYSAKYIPKNKISLGLSLYYWKWNSGTQKLVGIGGYEGLQTAFARTDITRGYSTAEHAAFVSYVEKGQTYMIWYENGTSFGDKLSLIRQNGFLGFSAWALGLEVPEVFNVI